MTVDTIIQGDCIETLKTLPDASVDLIFADPPYWLRVEGSLKRVEGTEYDGCDDDWDQFSDSKDYERFTREWLSECYRVLKKDGSFWVIGGMQCIHLIGAIMQELGFWIINDVIWHKKNPTPNFLGTRLNNSHETLIWATKGKRSRYTFHYKTAKELNRDTVPAEDFHKGVRKQLGSVWSIPVCAGSERLKDREGKKLHSTQKPEELLYRIIAISSSLEDLVLDPFGGTMTTAVAAKRLGRHYLCIERDESYCRHGQERIDAVIPEIDAVAKAEYDRKPLKVTMKEMIEAGFFTVGEVFYDKGGRGAAKLLEDARLELCGEILDMHTAAAKMKGSGAARLNGFDVWYVMRGDRYVPIHEVREEYRRLKEEGKE